MLQNAKGELYVAPDEKGGCDMMVFTPRDTIEFGAARLAEPRRSALALSVARQYRSACRHVIAGAGLLRERAAGPPLSRVDQVEVNADTQGLPALMLPHGLFQLQIVDASGTVQRRWQVTIPLPDTPLP